MLTRESSSSHNAKVFKIAAFLILLLVVPITVLVSQNQQTESSHANYTRSLAAVHATPENVFTNNKDYAIWFMSSPTSSDWIGLYAEGASDSGYLNKVLTSDCQNSKGPGNIHFGTCTFVMPNVAGIYEYRLFSGTTLIATSAQITVSTGVINLPSEFPTISPLLHPTFSPSQFPIRTPSCIPRPACLNSKPACEIVVPISGWCPVVSPSLK